MIMKKIPISRNLPGKASNAGQSVDIRGVQLDAVIDSINTLTGVDFNPRISFREACTKYYKDYTQTAAIAFTLIGQNVLDVGDIVYAKITTDGNGLTFSADFVESKNEATGNADEVLDCWFTLLPDFKVLYSIGLRV